MASSTTARLRFNNLLQTDIQAHPSKSILPSTLPYFLFAHPSMYSSFYLLIHLFIFSITHPSMYSSFCLLIHPRLCFLPLIHISYHLFAHPFMYSSFTHPSKSILQSTHSSIIYPLIHPNPSFDRLIYLFILSSFNYSCFQTLKLSFI